MHKLLSRVLTYLLIAAAPAAEAQKDIDRPKLVIGIAVDQMRWDYLYRYYDRYGSDGFKRLLGEGFACQNNMINYLPSFTGPGHASIFTGSVPSIHGIAGNEWLDNTTGKEWYCTEDPAVQGVGGSQQWGKMSPKNLLASTVTDELKLASNFRSKVFGVSLKDRACILPAGHLANGAFWYDDSTGNFMTSTFYMKQLPQWLNTFNARRLPDSFLRLNWSLLQPEASYTHSLPDNNPYEGTLKGEQAPVFPHKTEALAGKDYNTLRKLPYGNTLTLDLAEACISGEQMGRGASSDFLTINLASTDYAGHQYAPNALEMEDVYLRLDRDLAAFLRYLDQQVGKGNYLLFLTADHGAAHNEQFLADSGMNAGNISQDRMKKDLDSHLKSVLGKDSLVRFMDNYQVFLDDAHLQRIGADREQVKKEIIRWMAEQPGIAYAVDAENIGIAPVPLPIREMVVNGYNHNRSGCIQIIPQPGWYSGYGPTGTTHGTWNPYDTHIPLLFYGWHIPQGETFRTTHMTDIAATVAALLHIQMPSGCIGEVIPEVFGKK